jgi:nucleotide-binding universal stress UspA family protein
MDQGVDVTRANQWPIVVGVDGSVASRAALGWAASTAVAQRRDLIAVWAWQAHATVAPYAPLARRRPPEVEQALAAAGLTAAVHEVTRGVPAVTVRKVLAAGLAARVLLREAEGAAMLVLGGRRPASRFGPAIGAVALACLRLATCPVVVVGEPHEPWSAPRTLADSSVNEPVATAHRFS